MQLYLQVEQIGEAKVLWKKREFTTLLNVDEDERDPNELRTAFTLIRSVSVNPHAQFKQMIKLRTVHCPLLFLIQYLVWCTAIRLSRGRTWFSTVP